MTINRWAGAALLVVVAALYLWTLDNGLRPDELVGGDLITHQYAQVEARPSNAPGYPLYTMGGWLWFHSGQVLLRWALNPIQILSAYSMLWGLAALAMLYLILLRVMDGWWPAAALLTAFQATTYFFWYYSVTTEQYSSAVFQTLLLIWLALRWDDRPEDATLLGLAFVSGTMLANMLTTLFILPPLVWFILARPTSGGRMIHQYLQRPGLVAKAAVAALLPLSSYAYVYIRGAQHPEWRGSGVWPSTWAWFVDFITIQQGRDELAPGLTLHSVFTAEFPRLMWQELTIPVFVGGLVGLWFLGRRRAIFFYSTLLIYVLFCWGYRFGNWFQVIIPAYPIFVIGLAALLGRLKTALAPKPGLKKEEGGTPPQPPGLRRSVPPLTPNPGLKKEEGGTPPQPPGLRRSVPPLAPNPGLKKEEGGTPPQPPGLRRSVPPLTPNPGLKKEEGGTPPQPPRRAQGGRRYFHRRMPPGWRQGRYAPAVMVLLLAGLLGYNLAANFSRSNQRNLPGDTGLDPGWVVLADPITPPALIAAVFTERVALQYLTTVWQAGPEITPIDPDRLADWLGTENLYVTRQGAAGTAAVFNRAGVYPQAAGEQLIALEPFPLAALPQAATPAALSFGPALRLTGWELPPTEADIPAKVEARLQRATWQITLYWQISEPLAEDYTVSVRPLRGGQPLTVGDEPLIQDHQPVWGFYPTRRWTPGEIVRDVYALPLPPETAPEAVTVLVYRITADGFETLAEHTFTIQPSEP